MYINLSAIGLSLYVSEFLVYDNVGSCTGILDLSRHLHQMDIDISSFSCLAALSLVYGKIHNPYNKVTGCMSLTKDFANRRSDIVLLYNVASHRSREYL